MEEIDSNDELIVEKEVSLLLLDTIWLEDDELFNLDVIRIVSSKGEEIQTPSINIVPSHSCKRKHDDFASNY